MIELRQICIDIEKASAEAGNYIISESLKFDASKTESKGLNDFVSYVDRGAEKIMVERLRKIFPGAGFLAEEGTAGESGEDYCWVIDPLDGTTNFIHGVHPFAISTALTYKGEPVAGVVFEASGKEIFSSWKNGGAWLNNKRIYTSVSKKISDSLIATGFPYKDFSRLPSYLGCLGHMIMNCHGVRRMGSASIDLSYVACGRFDGFFEYGLKPWDIAAGCLILSEAGGKTSDFSGNVSKITGEEIIASNNHIHSEFLEIVSKFMV
jgi:myo-inositol-1(or 4)-monophosphatase